MGRVNIKVKLINYDDIIRNRDGHLEKNKIRSHEGDALADTGATMMTIPKEIFDKLGLNYSTREVTATYANGQKEKRKIARGLLVEINDREAEVECVVEENYDKILIGQIPLEYMDLHVDCKNGKLVPDPLSPDLPMIDIL